MRGEKEAVVASLANSLESRERSVGVLKNTMKNFAAFVDRGKANFGVGDSLLSEALPVLDEVLLNNLDHIVRATADSTKADEELRELLEGEVAVETLIDELLLNDLPELIVLELHRSGPINHHLQ